MKRRLLIAMAIVGLMAAATPGFAQNTQNVTPALSQGGYSIFSETMADMTFQEVEQVAKPDTIVLWPIGVIEEHGPHLPLGTDIYNSYLEMKQVARTLKAAGKSVVIAPPMYWGVNEATASFAGSFTIRPSTVKALIEDVFLSLRKDGFRTIYLTPGHNDRLHNQTLVEGVEAARATTGMRGFVVISAQVRDRLGLTGSEPHVLVNTGAGQPPAPASSTNTPQPPLFIDVHAGAGETSNTWGFFPNLVKADLIAGLKSTQYGPDDLNEWRKGWENARRKTPLGYFGDPSAASAQRGIQGFSAGSARTADLILKHFESLPWSK